jgi:hypothetical protein
MRTIHSPKTVFLDADLAQLQWVFDEVCSALERQRGRIEGDTKDYIRRRLFLLACNGTGDPETLRAHLLASFKRSPDQANV